MSEMSQALQVQNMEVLSGFVNDSLKDNVTVGGGSKQGSSTGQKVATPSNATIQVLSEEIDQYNKALLSLSNAVLALSNTQTANSENNNDGKEMVGSHLDKLLNICTKTNAKLNDIITSANQVNAMGLSNRLQAIENALGQITSSSSASIPVITEIHTDDELKSNWKTGLKDLALWGSFLYFVYAIITV